MVDCPIKSKACRSVVSNTAAVSLAPDQATLRCPSGVDLEKQNAKMKIHLTFDPLPIPAVLIPGCHTLPCKMSSLVAVETLHLGLSTPILYLLAMSSFLPAKTVNGEVQLQALVDGKKIVVSKASVRRDLQLEDANGFDYLPNAIIFEQLTLIGYEKLLQKLTFYKAFFSPQWKFLIHTILQCLSAKTTAWNEFSSTMTSAIICLANNQKFNFSMYIFESMMENLDSVVKFVMYPRFVQVFLDNQLEGMINNNIIYIAPSYTKKVFANMKRQRKDFSSRVTPLFSTMMVQAQQEQGEGSDMPTITQPSSSQPQQKHKPRNPKKKDTQIPQSNVPSDNLVDEVVNEENVSKHSNDPLVSSEDRLKLEELMTLCTNLQNRVFDLEHTKTTQALEIDNLKRRVKKLKKKQRSRTHRLRRLYKVGLSARVISSEDEGLGEEDASKQGRKIHDIDADEDITLENDMAEKEVSTVDPVTTVGEVVTTANVEVSTTSPTAATITIDKGKGIMVEEPLKMKKKDQVLFDEQEAIRLQAQFDKE
ncbi:hypothetical protein Tco_0954246 [Tanacetum coccineum]|uniref:Synaptobrevin, longin-like domain protein n=1 Tax=Tanacetum coccineum TaxID=301880 RepID=A0ABQ5E266_9ASTR